MYIVFIFKFILICPLIKAYIKDPIKIIAQRVNKIYGFDKSNILFIATLIQKTIKVIIYNYWTAIAPKEWILYRYLSIRICSGKEREDLRSISYSAVRARQASAPVVS